jgi:hypothetical protein
MGRGGQAIKVMPAAQAVVVTTGMGLEYDEVGRILTDAFVLGGTPLPGNPDGLAELEATVSSLSAAPAPTAVAPAPDIARTISENVYRFEANDLRLVTLRLETGAAAEATLHLSFSDQPQEAAWPVGLDGVYRFHGVTQAVRGSWTEASAFDLEVIEFTLTFSAPIQYRLDFDADRVRLMSPTFGVTLEGRVAGE